VTSAIAGAGISDWFLPGMQKQQKAGAKEDTDSRSRDQPYQGKIQQAADRKRRRGRGGAARLRVWRR
jgi:hypothetical protein